MILNHPDRIFEFAGQHKIPLKINIINKKYKHQQQRDYFTLSNATNIDNDLQFVN